MGNVPCPETARGLNIISGLSRPTFRRLGLPVLSQVISNDIEDRTTISANLSIIRRSRYNNSNPFPRTYDLTSDGVKSSHNGIARIRTGRP